MEADKNYQVFLTPVAAEKVKDQLVKRGTPEAYLRLGIRGGGCSGFSYVLQFEDDPPRAKDILFDVEGVHVIVDSKSILYLNGATLDWEKTLMNQGYKFRNPHEKSSCGCGHSFTV
jgi:iron-sulfur cluster assembly protein